MRVLFVTPRVSVAGGVARSARRVTAALRARGHAVLIACPDLDVFPGERTVDNERWRFGDTDDLQVCCDEALAAARQHRAEIVVGWYGSSAGFCGVAAARLLRRPSVLCLRGNDLDRDFFLPERHGRLAWAVQRADAVATVSSEMAGKVTAWFARDATFVGNSVDGSVFYPDPEAAVALRVRWGLDERPVVGLFGEFKPKRGLDRLGRWAEALAGWQVLLVGHVRSEVSALVPCGARLVETLRDDETLRAAYSLCDVVLQPSQHDGMPNVVLEAMACERTVFASPVGGLPDVIRHGETGLRLADDESWSEALRAGPVPALGRAARASLRGPDDEAADYEALLSSLL